MLPFQSKHSQWEKVVKTYQRDISRSIDSNKKFRNEINRLNSKMMNLESYICQLQVTQAKNKDIENKLKEFQVLYNLIV